jgi:restriction system protein
MNGNPKVICLLLFSYINRRICPKKTIQEAIVAAFKKVGMRMSAKMVYHTIMEHYYYRFRAINPAHIVQTQIRRQCEGLTCPSSHKTKLFVLLPDGNYWLKEEPLPPGNRSSEKDILFENSVSALESLGDQLKQIQEKYTSASKEFILCRLNNLDSYAFEQFARILLQDYGFSNVKVTKAFKDGGIDGFGTLKVGITELNVAYQCKKWKNTVVGRAEVDKFRGAAQGRYEQGIIFTTSTFSKDAQKATRQADAVPIIVIDGALLVDFIVERNVGISTLMYPLYTDFNIDL